MAAKVNPEFVKLLGWDSQRFLLMDGNTVVPASWTITPPELGSMSGDGVYTAPRWIFFGRRVVVSARDPRSGAPSGVTAEVELSTLRTWVNVVSAFLTTFSVVLLIVLAKTWPKDYSDGRTSLAVGPASVVLKKGDTQFFTASAPVTWSQNAPNGVYTATGTETTAVVVATMPGEAAAGTVTVGESSLRVVPPLPVLHSGEELQLIAEPWPADTPTWVSEICDTKGLCRAPKDLSAERVVLATVHTTTPSLSASVLIRMVPSGPTLLAMMGFAMLFGALGGLVHATNSLIAFVGSSRFVVSWVLFYLARPFIGATMALFVFLIFRGQLTADTVKASNLVAVAAVASLAGLFSDRAAEKLREIFDVLVGPKRDDRTNKLENGGAATAPATPAIASLAPAQIVHGSTPPILVVRGTGFARNCFIKINGTQRATTFHGDSEATVTLDPQDVANAGSLAVVLINPNGDASSPATLTVT